MHTKKLIVLITVYCLNLVYNVESINHWILKDAKILQKLDSPFFMRDPKNLMAFLKQIHHNEYVEKSYLELLRKRQQIVDHLKFSIRYGEDLVEQAKCAMDYYLIEKHMSYLKITPNHLKRIDLPERTEIPSAKMKTIPTKDQTIEPICVNYYKLTAGPATYDHLESFRSEQLKMAVAEREQDSNAGLATMELIRRFAVNGLRNFPNSWKFHTLSSYYWRMRGNVLQALPCARIGAMLAPSTHKDIPLLSLGTILFRMGNLNDADIILTAAVHHAPKIAENHMILGSALAMKHDFNRSLQHFDAAERLDASTLPRSQQVRSFITCLENLTKKTSKMYSYVKYMKNEVREFKKLKLQISKSHELLVQQQLPLGARYLDSKETYKDLYKRDQYCSMRAPKHVDDEPALFCDFYTDMQMRLKAKDVDIETLERDLKANTDAIMRQVASEIRKQFNMEQLKAAKAQIPTYMAN